VKLQDVCGNGNFQPCLYYTFAGTGCGTTCFGPTFCCGGTKVSYSLCGCIFSDRRLKTNIVRIGTHKLGIGLYEYEMNGVKSVGVMADEVLPVMPAAVKMVNGYYCVNYQMIDA
jgi:hypothetical protein